MNIISLAFSKLIIGFVKVYRSTIGALFVGHCRHYPSCSQYMIDSIKKYGPWRGSYKGIKRILRCHPFGSGGYDPA